jgi:predicted LPLAT superfamily acyltransferase
MRTRRWYAHRFHNATSLRLILGIIPWVPRALVPPIAVVTTAYFIARMRRERQAAARNQRRILGGGGPRLWLSVWRQFYGFSRFMVSHTELAHLTPEALRARMGADPEGVELIREGLDRGRGVVMLTAHLGNWEAGVRFLASLGAPVNLVMHPDRASAAERWLMRRRAGSALRVVRAGDSPLTLLTLRAALERNEIVALQGDRVLGERDIQVDLFGAPFAFPEGPFLLASLCGAELRPVFVLPEGWWRWRSVFGEPVRIPRTGDRRSDLASGVAQYAASLEQVVRRHPHQWFNFYDLWRVDAERA